MFLNYSVKIHCQKILLRNYACTTLRPSLRWREALFGWVNFKPMQIFIFKYRLEISIRRYRIDAL